MRPIAETPRHRAHLTKPGPGTWARAALGPVLAPILAPVFLTVAACGGALPRAARGEVRASDYVEVPFAPRTPPVEIVPERPRARAPGEPLPVWVDGSWAWTTDRFRWVSGAWVVAPAGARRAPWVLVRRAPDGQLFFAPAVWRDGAGRPIDEPPAVARARTRLPQEGAEAGEP